MDHVREFIDEESSRLDFTLDFNHHLILRFYKMYSGNAEAAEIFAERFGEIVDNSDDLSGFVRFIVKRDCCSMCCNNPVYSHAYQKVKVGIFFFP